METNHWNGAPLKRSQHNLRLILRKREASNDMKRGAGQPEISKNNYYTENNKLLKLLLLYSKGAQKS